MSTQTAAERRPAWPQTPLYQLEGMASHYEDGKRYCNLCHTEMFPERKHKPECPCLVPDKLLSACEAALALHDDAVFICGKDDERAVESMLNQLRTAIADAISAQEPADA